jgi:hypothetical protein
MSIGTQSGWYGVATLLVQLAFLISGIWFARNFLKAMRVFQEQMGALLKLSITTGPAEPRPANGSAKPASEKISSYRMMPPESGFAATTVSRQPEKPRFEVNGYERVSLESPRVAVREPLVGRMNPYMASSGEAAREERQTERQEEAMPAYAQERTGAWRGLSAWLQTPMSTAPVDAQATGLRRVITWLQTPAGN